MANIKESFALPVVLILGVLLSSQSFAFDTSTSTWSSSSDPSGWTGSGFSVLGCTFGSPPEPAGVITSCESNNCPDPADPADDAPDIITLKAAGTAFCGILDSSGFGFEKNKAAFFEVNITFQGVTASCAMGIGCVYELIYVGDGDEVSGTLTLDVSLLNQIPQELGLPDLKKEGCKFDPNKPAVGNNQPCVLIVGVDPGLDAATFFPKIESKFKEGQLLAFTETSGGRPEKNFLARYCHDRFDTRKPGLCDTPVEEDRELALNVECDYRPNTNDQLNVNGNNVVPIVCLGTETFDGNDVNPDSVRVQGDIIPVSVNAKKVNGDEFIDIELKVTEAEVAATFEGTLANGQTRFVSVTGSLFDSTLFRGRDDVIISGVSQ